MKLSYICTFLALIALFLYTGVQPAAAYVVSDLPSGNLIINPWFRDPNNNNNPSLYGWEDNQTSPYGFSISQKTADPSPDIVLGTAARWANGIGQGGYGVGIGGVEGALYQDIANIPTCSEGQSLDFDFQTYWISLQLNYMNIDLLEFVDGEWVLANNLFSTTSSSVGSWQQTSVIDFVDTTPSSLYRLHYRGMYPVIAQWGYKFTGVYLAAVCVD